MVVPVGEDIQYMYTLRKTGDNTFEEKQHGMFRFVPLLGDKEDSGC
jgi:protein-L-isoaspartate O-methyltransferase